MSKKKQEKKRPSKDPLIPLKHIAYCWSQLPPNNEFGYDEFVQYAKFQLCVKSKRLMKDPIWDSYAVEEILVEYYAHVYQKSEKEREKFLTVLQKDFTDNEDIYDWLDRMVDENQKDNKKLEDLEDHISFKPDSLGD